MRRLLNILILSALPVSTFAEKHFIWRVQRGASVMYLAGAVHLTQEQDLPLPPVYDAILEASDVFVTETDLDTLNSPQASEDWAQLAAYSEGETLSDEVPPGTVSSLRIFTIVHPGYPSVSIESYRPWIHALWVFTVSANEHGFSGERGIDYLLYQRAQAAGKPLGELEDWRAHNRVFAGLPVEAQVKLLQVTMSQAGSAEIELRKTIDAWRAGDAEFIANAIQAEKAQQPELHRRVFTDRNQAWFTPLTQFLDTGQKTFVMVGAGHLPGDDGLLRLLEGQRLHVRQVSDVRVELDSSGGVTLFGTPGISVSLQVSADLSEWSDLQSVTLNDSEVRLEPGRGEAKSFYRAVWAP